MSRITGILYGGNEDCCGRVGGKMLDHRFASLEIDERMDDALERASDDATCRAHASHDIPVILSVVI